MTDTPPSTPPRQPLLVTVKIDGKDTTIPWAFRDPKVEGRAAKTHGIEYPGTARKS